MQRRATWAMIESRDLTIKDLDERIIRQQAEIERLRAEVEKLTDQRDNYRIVLVSKVTGELFERTYFARPDAHDWAIIFAGGIEEIADEALDRCHRNAEKMARDG